MKFINKIFRSDIIKNVQVGQEELTEELQRLRPDIVFERRERNKNSGRDRDRNRDGLRNRCKRTGRREEGAETEAEAWSVGEGRPAKAKQVSSQTPFNRPCEPVTIMKSSGDNDPKSLGLSDESAKSNKNVTLRSQAMEWPP
jgi:hypothetical protein